MKMHVLISAFLLGTIALAQGQTKSVPQAPAAGVQYPPVMHRRPGITSRFALCFALTILLLPIFCARGQNLLDNPGFEQGTNRWTVRASESLLATNRFHSGKKAVAIVNRNGFFAGMEAVCSQQAFGGSNGPTIRPLFEAGVVE